MLSSVDLTISQWTLLTVVGTITALILFIRWKLTYWERRGIHGPKPFLPFVSQLSNATKPVCAILIDNYKRYGKVYGAYSGLQPNLVVADPDLLRSICVKDFSSWPQGFGAPGYLHEIERDSLVNLHGPKWKRMRTLLSPTFSSGKIKKMFQLIKTCNMDAQKILATMTNNGQAEFDLKYFWGRYNLDVIAKCCFAANLGVYDDNNESLLNKFIQLFEPRPLKFLFLVFLPIWFVNLTKYSTSHIPNLLYLKDLTYALIDKRKNNREKANDFLQLLIDLGEEDIINENGEKQQTNKLTDNEIVASSVVFLMAGYETTSTLLTWACYRLATNQKVQERLFDEVSKNDINDYETLSSLPYLDAVINETLRIDPPVILFQRHNHTEYVIPGTNATVQKGTPCSIPTYAIHHDPENYPDPEVFDPERFIRNSPKPFTFLPFGAGPRICIGMRFALINAKLSLASLVRDYNICTTEKTPKNVEIAPGAIILTAKSLKIAITPRF